MRIVHTQYTSQVRLHRIALSEINCSVLLFDFLTNWTSFIIIGLSLWYVIRLGLLLYRRSIISCAIVVKTCSPHSIIQGTNKILLCFRPYLEEQLSLSSPPRSPTSTFFLPSQPKADTHISDHNVCRTSIFPVQYASLEKCPLLSYNYWQHWPPDAPGRKR